jgi:hypothetical protein
MDATRRAFLIATAAGTALRATAPDVLNTLGEVASRYRNIREFSVRADVASALNGGTISQYIKSANWKVVLVSRHAETRYEIYYPGIGTLVCWTDGKSVYQYEDAGRLYFEAGVSSSEAVDHRVHLFAQAERSRKGATR